MCSKFRRQNSGFTLIELMITVILISVILGIGVPSFKEVIRSSRLSSASNTFISSMHLARSEAVKRRTKINVTASDSSNSANEWGNDGWTISVVSSGETLKTVQALQGSNISLNSTNDVATFTYSADGSVSSADALNVCTSIRAFDKTNLVQRKYQTYILPIGLFTSSTTCV